MQPIRLSGKLVDTRYQGSFFLNFSCDKPVVDAPHLSVLSGVSPRLSPGRGSKSACPVPAILPAGVHDQGQLPQLGVQQRPRVADVGRARNDRRPWHRPRGGRDGGGRRGVLRRRPAPRLARYKKPPRDLTNAALQYRQRLTPQPAAVQPAAPAHRHLAPTQPSLTISCLPCFPTKYVTVQWLLK